MQKPDSWTCEYCGKMNPDFIYAPAYPSMDVVPKLVIDCLRCGGQRPGHENQIITPSDQSEIHIGRPGHDPSITGSMHQQEGFPPIDPSITGSSSSRSGGGHFGHRGRPGSQEVYEDILINAKIETNQRIVDLVRESVGLPPIHPETKVLGVEENVVRVGVESPYGVNIEYHKPRPPEEQTIILDEELPAYIRFRIFSFWLPCFMVFLMIFLTQVNILVWDVSLEKQIFDLLLLFFGFSSIGWVIEGVGGRWNA